MPSRSLSLKSYCNVVAFGFDTKFNDLKIITSSIGCSGIYEYEMYPLSAIST